MQAGSTERLIKSPVARQVAKPARPAKRPAIKKQKTKIGVKY